MSFFKERVQSFGYAFRGILTFFSTQPNAVIHLIAAIVVVVLGIIYDVTNVEWLFLILAIALVIIAEAVNSSIEFLADAVSKKENQFIKKAKDVGAAAVLLAAIFATIIGLFIFVPKL